LKDGVAIVSKADRLDRSRHHRLNVQRRSGEAAQKDPLAVLDWQKLPAGRGQDQLQAGDRQGGGLQGATARFDITTTQNLLRLGGNCGEQ
jgi:hypothetical protein